MRTSCPEHRGMHGKSTGQAGSAVCLKAVRRPDCRTKHRVRNAEGQLLQPRRIRPALPAPHLQRRSVPQPYSRVVQQPLAHVLLVLLYAVGQPGPGGELRVV